MEYGNKESKTRKEKRNWLIKNLKKTEFLAVLERYCGTQFLG